MKGELAQLYIPGLEGWLKVTFMDMCPIFEAKGTAYIRASTCILFQKQLKQCPHCRGDCRGDCKGDFRGKLAGLRFGISNPPKLRHLHYDTEHIPLDHLRIGAAVSFTVFHHLPKGHDTFIAFDQIGIHKIPVVIAIQVHLAQDQVGAVMGNSS